MTKVFPSVDGGRPTAAVDGVSLTIEPGELFFLLGPSGCGKTTLLRMIAGFIEPTGGSIHFREPSGTRDVTHLAPEKRNTGMVFQSYALWPHMTVAQNVAFGLEVRGLPRDERERRVGEALTAVRMDHLAARRPTQLSGGQQQRVALARAMVIRPSVLLLDEPLSNLDAKLRLELRSEIRRVCKDSGITTVYVTHDQKEALSMADRVAVMAAGKVVQAGSPAALYRRPRTRFVAEFLGETNILEGAVEVQALPHSSAGGVHVRVRTAAGVVEAVSPDAPPAAGSAALVSVRPEGVRLAPDGPGLEGKVRERIYLGDTAQYSVQLVSGQVIRAAVLNPPASLPFDAPGSHVFVTLAPEDTVLLPAHAGE
ncbi:MAG: ABC transporter ATP-binding protein [Planctomycetota bacterium]|nr:ABC transporter ATP-binding protein [Planctomycetota bacterium]